MGTVSDLRPIAGLTHLQWLMLANTKVGDIAPLAGMKKLKFLMLRNSPAVSDLSPLQTLTEMQSLYLQNTYVRDLTPLARMKNLEVLILDRTGVDDLSPLKGLKKLGWLSLVNTHVSDITPLTGLTALAYLELDQTNVSSEDVNKLRQALPKCSTSWSDDKPSPQRLNPPADGFELAAPDSSVPISAAIPLDVAVPALDQAVPARLSAPTEIRSETPDIVEPDTNEDRGNAEKLDLYSSWASRYATWH